MSFISIVKKLSGKSKRLGIQYDRDIILLPKSYAGKHSSIKIPRSGSAREFLSQNGLKGKIQLTSDITEEEIFAEIRSVFQEPMGNNKSFPFQILQPT